MRPCPVSDWPKELPGGYKAVPYEATSLNGMFFPQLLHQVVTERVVVLDPNGRALQSESGRPCCYDNLASARNDVEILISLT